MGCGLAEDVEECEVADDLEDVVDFVLFFFFFVFALWWVVEGAPVPVDVVDSGMGEDPGVIEGLDDGVGDCAKTVAAAKAAVMRNL